MVATRAAISVTGNHLSIPAPLESVDLPAMRPPLQSLYQLPVLKTYLIKSMGHQEGKIIALQGRIPPPQAGSQQIEKGFIRNSPATQAPPPKARPDPESQVKPGTN